MEAPESLGSETAEAIILRWDSTASDKMLFQGDDQEVDRYLQAVDEIQRSMYSDDLNKMAMARLQLEFRTILISNSNLDEADFSSPPPTPKEEPQEQEAASACAACFFFVKRRHDNDDNGDRLVWFNHGGSASIATDRATYRSTRNICEIDIPSDVVYDLRCIVERMISSGYLRECIQVYATVRHSALEASFRRLEIENLSIGDVQRLKRDQLEAIVEHWIRAAKVCVRTLFASEKKLCRQIFDEVGTDIDDACFMETVQGPATQLFNFAEGVSISRRSSEDLFVILDLHDSLMNLIPDIDVVFHFKSSKSICIQAAEILSRLAEAARVMLSEFEYAVLHETSKVPLLDVTIHPLTKYVMNYITFMSDCKQTLNKLIVSKPSTASTYLGDPTTLDMDFAELEGKTPLAIHLIWIILILQFNLDGKSKHCKDASLSHLFMMNNVHYMFQIIRVSPKLREMIGDDYLKKLIVKFRQEATSYERATWARVLYCLRYDGLPLGSRKLKSALRERFKSFNAIFTEIHSTQAVWLIPNSQLREELRISISQKLISAYRSFRQRFWHHIESGGHPENYIMYSVEDLEAAVLDLFEGIPVSKHLRRRSQWS